ncbi:MAG: dCTP deaminase [Aquificae bacterium]|nr:dCTP deaminase [Aquificota bacterium]
MILSKEKIKDLIEIGTIEIDPLDLELHLEDSSIAIRLSPNLYTYPLELEPQLSMLDIKNPYLNILEKEYISESGFVLEPKKFILAESLEYISIPEYINPFLDSKFRLDKFGLVLINKGWLGAGFEGFITLCLYNAGQMPIRLFKEEKIAQLVLHEVK